MPTERSLSTTQLDRLVQLRATELCSRTGMALGLETQQPEAVSI